jgi:hypothetical protein
MPTCSRCQRRVWFWSAGLFGGPCSICRAERAAARAEAAKAREAARRADFERSGVLRRAWLGASRGAPLGAFGLALVAASLVARSGGDPGVRYPFPGLPLQWILLSLAAVIVAGFVGWWLSSWLVGITCLVGVGAVGGATLGCYRGLCGRWELFAESHAEPRRQSV